MTEHEVVVSAFTRRTTGDTGSEASQLVAHLSDDVRLIDRACDGDEVAQMSRGVLAVAGEAIGRG